MDQNVKLWPPAWMRGAHNPAQPPAQPSAKPGIPPPPVPAEWTTAPPTPTNPPPAKQGPSAPAGPTQTTELPPLAPDAAGTAAEILKMMDAWAAKEPQSRLALRRPLVLALAIRASGLNRQFDHTLAALDRYQTPIHLYGAFALNEVWMDGRVAEAYSFWGPSYGQVLYTGIKRVGIAEVDKPLLRTAGLAWPGQIYLATPLLRHAESFASKHRPLTQESDRRALSAIWAFWNYSSDAAIPMIGALDSNVDLDEALVRAETFA